MNFKFKSLTNAGVQTFEELLKKYRGEIIVGVFSAESLPDSSNNLAEVFNEACSEIERLEEKLNTINETAEEGEINWNKAYSKLYAEREKLERENSRLKGENMGLRETAHSLEIEKEKERLKGVIKDQTIISLKIRHEDLNRTLKDIWDGDTCTFMGKPIGYWAELKSRADSMNYQDLIAEISKLKWENANLKGSILTNKLCPDL